MGARRPKVFLGFFQRKGLSKHQKSAAHNGGVVWLGFVPVRTVACARLCVTVLSSLCSRSRDCSASVGAGVDSSMYSAGAQRFGTCFRVCWCVGVVYVSFLPSDQIELRAPRRGWRRRRARRGRHGPAPGDFYFLGGGAAAAAEGWALTLLDSQARPSSRPSPVVAHDGTTNQTLSFSLLSWSASVTSWGFMAAN